MIRDERAFNIKLPFDELEEMTGLKFSDIDAFHSSTDFNIIIEHTMTAFIKKWTEEDWKKFKVYKYIEAFKYSMKPTFIICTTNCTDRREQGRLYYDDLRVCAIFKCQNGECKTIDIKKTFDLPDSLTYIIKQLEFV